MAIRNWAFRWKILLIIGVLLAGMICSLGLGLDTLHRELSNSRHAKVQQLVQVASGVITHYVDEAKAGRMTQDEAKAAALASVKGLRYDKSEYFWVNDMQGRMVMHPIKPELDGKDLMGFKDPNGKTLFKEMVDTVRRQKSGFVGYDWPKPGFDKPVPKISFVQGIDGWDWLVGSGIYTDDIDTAFWGEIRVQAAQTAVAVVLALFIAWWIGRDMVQAMRRITASMERLASGDTGASEMGPERRDEFGDMVRSVEIFRGNAVAVKRLEQEQINARENNDRERRETLSRLARELEEGVSSAADAVSDAAEHLHDAASVMTNSSDHANVTGSAVTSAAEQTSANVEAVAAAAEELSASIDEIDRRVAQSSATAEEAVAAVGRTDSVVRGLSEGASRIGQIVGLINEIAAQTNLLALNATIEAARAGEAGKGFAVVAGEVKNLANQTARATGEISSQISAIQTTSNDAVRAIQDIGATIEKMSGISGEIAAAVRQQGLATREIAQNVGVAASRTQEMTSDIGTVNRAIGDAGSAARDVLGAADRLTKDSQALKTGLSRFLAGVRSM